MSRMNGDSGALNVCIWGQCPLMTGGHTQAQSFECNKVTNSLPACKDDRCLISRIKRNNLEARNLVRNLLYPDRLQLINKEDRNLPLQGKLSA